jgi:hypothetical protein
MDKEYHSLLKISINNYKITVELTNEKRLEFD